MDIRHRLARQQYDYNDPPVEVNQIWNALNDEGKVLRKVRILAPYPDPDRLDGGRSWIVEDLRGTMSRKGMTVCPEFNLRYVFELEKP